MTGSDSDSGQKKCWRKIRPQVVHVVVVQGLAKNMFSRRTVAADTQERMVWWTRGCRETADRMEATDERRAGQAMAADRHTDRQIG